ncbi:RHS repeat-associated core domain-containing protein [Immundisolibacter sp.]|uniref:RHS repeat-associated core domain-containing protein n=1 Tax=Immundisolibacter sp. TaxID=1934948 RepID=UPI0035614741
MDVTTGVCQSYDSAKNLGAPDSCAGNPINPAIGYKFQVENDYSSVSSSPLKVERYYDSSAIAQGTAFGAHWRHFYARGLTVSSGTEGEIVHARRADGKQFDFSAAGAEWTADADIPETLTRLVDSGGTPNSSGTPIGWRIRTRHDETEDYDNDGRLLTLADRAGRVQTLAYDAAGLLTSVTDAFGRALVFSYDSADQIASVIDPDGGVFTYAHDGIGNLTSVTFPDGSQRTYLYNESAHTQGANLPNALTGIVDENGARFATYEYDTQGRAVSTEHAGGADRTHVAYNADGSRAITDALGTTSVHQFATVLGVVKNTAVSQPCSVCGGSDSSSKTYDASGNVASRLDFNNNLTCYTHDLTRNLETERVEGLSGSSCPGTAVSGVTRSIHTEWHPDFRLPQRVAEPQRRITYTYDGSGNVVTRTEQATTDTDGSQGFAATLTGTPRVWTYTYNADGQLLTENGPRTDVSDITTYAYYTNAGAGHARGDLQQTSNALGHVTQYTQYDPSGRLLEAVDPNGAISSFTYDARGRLKTRTVAGAVTAFDYDPAGNLTQVTWPDASHVAYGYDPAHRLTTITDSLGNRVTYTLDAAGNRLGETWSNPDGSPVRSHTRVFDALSRLQQDIGAAGQTTQYAYDAQGNLTSRIDPKGQTTAYVYDSLNRLGQMVDPLGGTSSTSYNGQARPNIVTAPNGATTTYTYNGLGDLLSELSPDRGTTNMTYDAAGNLKTRVDARGVTRTYTYDALNRLKSETDSSGGWYTYTYDNVNGCSNGIGRLCKVNDSVSTGQRYTVFAYDVHGWVSSETRVQSGITYITRYTYDAAGRQQTITYPTGLVVAYSRDSAGRITAITADGSPIVQSLTYDAAGAPRSQTLGNGLVETIDVDQDGQRTGHAIGTGAVDASLGYDPNGNIVSRTGPAGVSTYTYDALDRLSGEAGPVKNQNFSYDANGNRLSDASGAYSYQAASNRLSSIPSGSVSVDAAGNVNRAATSVYRYTYDGASRLANATDAGAAAISYSYNHLNQLVHRFAHKTKYGQSVVYHYDRDGHLLAETRPSNGERRRSYVWRDDVLVAQIEHQPSQTVLYMETDHLGAVRAARSSSGQVVWRWDSDAFGALKPNEDPDGDGQKITTITMRFPGQIADRLHPAVYNWNRYYDPTSGRFVSSDPIGLDGGINTYGYVGGNPLAWVDPSGLIECEWVSFGPRTRTAGRRWVPGEIVRRYTCRFKPKPQISNEPLTPQSMIRPLTLRPGAGGIPLPLDINPGLECPYREENTGYYEDIKEVVEYGYYRCRDGCRTFNLWSPPRKFP